MRRRRLPAEKPRTPRAFAVGSADGGSGGSLIITDPPRRCANASATDSAEGGGCKVRIRHVYIRPLHPRRGRLTNRPTGSSAWTAGTGLRAPKRALVQRVPAGILVGTPRSAGRSERCLSCGARLIPPSIARSVRSACSASGSGRCRARPIWRRAARRRVAGVPRPGSEPGGTRSRSPSIAATRTN